MTKLTPDDLGAFNGLPVVSLLYNVRGLPDDARICVSDDGLQATVDATLPELARLTDALHTRFVRHGDSYDMLFICKHYRRYWLYLSTRSNPRLNALRCGIVNYNNQLNIKNFILK